MREFAIQAREAALAEIEISSEFLSLASADPANASAHLRDALYGCAEAQRHLDSVGNDPLAWISEVKEQLGALESEIRAAAQRGSGLSLTNGFRSSAR